MTKLSSEEIKNLPNIEQVLDIISQLQDDFLDSGGWTTKLPDICELANALGYDCSYASYHNPYNPDDFIVSRLNSKRYCFKPNLRYVPFLFRGEREEYPSIISAFERGDSSKRLISNLKTMDFFRFVKSHPLCRLFDNGIKLTSCKEPFFFEMNYYGLAQHYNYNTGLIDFSSSSLVAAFFATTVNKGDDVYEPIIDVSKYPYGVIYLHIIDPRITFGMFSTIGQQIFPRTGAQLGFFYQEKIAGFDVNKLVYKIPFKHDSGCSTRIFNMFDKGKKLFPKDELTDIAKIIRDSNKVTLMSFSDNLFSNPGDTLEGNMKACAENGITIDSTLDYHFTPEILQSFWLDIKNGRWEDFCKPIQFYGKNGNELKEELLSLPSNPYYKQYFNSRYYERLFYHEIERIRLQSVFPRS